MKFRSRQFEVEAYQYLAGSNLPARFISRTKTRYDILGKRHFLVVDKTGAVCSQGDWLVMFAGDLYVFNNVVFHEFFDGPFADAS